MRKARIFVILSVAVAAVFGAVGTHSVSATGLTYDIEASGAYCSGGGNYCVNATKGLAMAGYNYAQADAYNYNHPGFRSGPPDQVYLECDRYFLDASGVLRFQYSYVEAYKAVNAFTTSRGTVGGTAAVMSPDGTETNTAAEGSQNTSGNDPVTGTMGTSNGFENTNNYTDDLTGGQINIYIWGTLFNRHFDPTKGYFVHDPNSMGPISCHTTANGITVGEFPRPSGEVEFE
jgi:hypothetical protein